MLMAGRDAFDPEAQMHLLQLLLLQQDTAMQIGRTASIDAVYLWSSSYPKIPGDHRIKMGLIEVPSNRDDRLCGIIMSVDVVQEVSSTKSSDRLLPTQNRAAERMAFQALT